MVKWALLDTITHARKAEIDDFGSKLLIFFLFSFIKTKMILLPVPQWKKTFEVNKKNE